MSAVTALVGLIISVQSKVPTFDAEPKSSAVTARGGDSFEHVH